MPSDEELAAAGLIGECYDSVFSIRQVLRKINDIPIPLRRGVTLPQIGVFLLTLIGSFLSYVLLIRPATNLIGVHVHPLLIVLYIFGIPGFAAQRVLKPMRYGKSISTTAASWWRDLTDDPVHARGMPVRGRKEDTVEGPTLVFWRRWVPAAEVTEPEETDPRAEALQTGFIDSTEQWAAEMSMRHAAVHAEARRNQREVTVTTATTRSRGASVILDDEE